MKHIDIASGQSPMKLHGIKTYVSAVICAAAIVAASAPAWSAGREFIEEAKMIYRVVACGPGAIPAGFDAAQVHRHCSLMEKKFEHYRATFIDKAAPFMASVVPGDAPRKVVIPFGGGDLMPALTVFPDAREITTISLESAGDPRRLAAATPGQIAHALDTYRTNVGFMLLMYDNSNDSVRNMDRGPIPGQLAFSMTALAVMGYEPVSLRFFNLLDDGSIHYLDDGEITSLEKVRAQKLKSTWVDTDYSVAFHNMELVFRKKGGGPSITHRHIAFNLDDRHFTGSILEKHLAAKGKISVMIKGASYLLWFDNFSAVRNYLLKNMALCMSDSTGILPKHASKAGFTQLTYGRFNGAYLENEGGADAVALRALFQSQPYRPLSFTFGSSDIHRSSHLIITRPR
jgi:hypothetical protein